MNDDTTYLQCALAPKPDPDQPAVLIQIHGEGLGRRVALGPDPIRLGRSDECEIPVEMEAISRQHCRIVADERGHVLEDLGSTNGTRLNDRPIEAPVVLADGDLVALGDAVFRFVGADNVEQAYFEEIGRLAVVDGLTQIANRRCFDEFVRREVSRCGRRDHDLCLLMIDIDHFKRVNDEHGHVAGDAVLRQIARRIESLPLRQQDCFARYGGEEFAIVLTDCALADAAEIAERIRLRVENAPVELAEGTLEVTVSIGVARCVPGEPVEALVEAADGALYEAKNAGRNRACTAADRVPAD